VVDSLTEIVADHGPGCCVRAYVATPHAPSGKARSGFGRSGGSGGCGGTATVEPDVRTEGDERPEPPRERDDDDDRFGHAAEERQGRLPAALRPRHGIPRSTGD